MRILGKRAKALVHQPRYAPAVVLFSDPSAGVVPTFMAVARQDPLHILPRRRTLSRSSGRCTDWWPAARAAGRDPAPGHRHRGQPGEPGLFAINEQAAFR